MLCACFLYLLALACAWVNIILSTIQYLDMEQYWSFVLENALCLLLISASTSLCLGEYLSVYNSIFGYGTIFDHLTLNTLCACVLYLLALACAWVNIILSTIQYLDMEQYWSFVLENALCLLLISASNSLCLGEYLTVYNLIFGYGTIFDHLS